MKDKREELNKGKGCYNLQNKSAPARQKSGPGSMACGWKHFFVLIFWLLFHQGKSDWPRPAKRATM